MKPFSFFCLLAVALCFSFTTKSNLQKIKEYFSVPGPVEYNKNTYQLSWSAHPAANYYKQEYLSPGQQAARYNQMLMIEVVTGDMDIKDAAGAKINEITARKKTDPLANYQVIENKATGEYLLDFIMSQSTGGNPSVVEWNAYRYTKLKDKSGKTGILLFAISKRSYGNATTGFLKDLKTERQKDIAALAAYKIPDLVLKPE